TSANTRPLREWLQRSSLLKAETRSLTSALREVGVRVGLTDPAKAGSVSLERRCGRARIKRNSAKRRTISEASSAVAFCQDGPISIIDLGSFTTLDQPVM